MSAQHTPGPWFLEVGDRNHRYALVKCADDRTIHYKYGSGTKREADLDEVNARLISAAPDLLAACQQFVPTGVATNNTNVPDNLAIPLDVTMGELRKLSAAIAKALGQGEGQ